MKRPVYLDYQATTPLDPEFLNKMLPYFHEDFGNPSSSTHVYGWKAKSGVEYAREQIATGLHCSSHEITFTSGSTESNQIAILGFVNQLPPKKTHLITTDVEHPSVLECFKYLESRGYLVSYLGVDSFGFISLDDLKSAITPQTKFISVIYGNNEIGTIQPISEIGKIAKSKKIAFHTDATQVFTKKKINVDEIGVDLLSMSAHKIYGPKGIGALFVRRKNPRINLSPLYHGGGQENGLRPGTLNVPAIVGFGFAVESGLLRQESIVLHINQLSKNFLEKIKKECENVYLNGHPCDRVPGNVNLYIKGVSAQLLMSKLKDDLAFSTNSACSSIEGKTSHVLKAIGHTNKQIDQCIRLGIGKNTTQEEVSFAADRLITEIKKIRTDSV